MAKKYPKLAAILKKLLFQRDIKAVDLARAVDLPPPTIHRLVTGKSTRPYKSSLQPIADYFSIEVEQLLGEKPLPSDKKTNNLEKNHFTNIPLIPWDELKHIKNNKSCHEIPFIGSISELGFATVMPDTSMEAFIQRNSIVIFDPMVKPIDRSCVLVKLNETKAYVVRELLVDAEHQYLKPLNPDLSSFKMRLLDQKDEIIGCLIEIRFNIQNDSRLETSGETQI